MQTTDTQPSELNLLDSSSSAHAIDVRPPNLEGSDDEHCTLLDSIPSCFLSAYESIKAYWPSLVLGALAEGIPSTLGIFMFGAVIADYLHAGPTAIWVCLGAAVLFGLLIFGFTYRLLSIKHQEEEKPGHRIQEQEEDQEEDQEEGQNRQILKQIVFMLLYCVTAFSAGLDAGAAFGQQAITKHSFLFITAFAVLGTFSFFCRCAKYYISDIGTQVQNPENDLFHQPYSKNSKTRKAVFQVFSFGESMAHFLAAYIVYSDFISPYLLQGQFKNLFHFNFIQLCHWIFSEFPAGGGIGQASYMHYVALSLLGLSVTIGILACIAQYVIICASDLDWAASTLNKNAQKEDNRFGIIGKILLNPYFNKFWLTLTLLPVFATALWVVPTLFGTLEEQIIVPIMILLSIGVYALYKHHCAHCPKHSKTDSSQEEGLLIQTYKRISWQIYVSKLLGQGLLVAAASLVMASLIATKLTTTEIAGSIHQSGNLSGTLVATLVFAAGFAIGCFLGHRQWKAKNANNEIDLFIAALVKQQYKTQGPGKAIDNLNNKISEWRDHRLANGKKETIWIERQQQYDDDNAEEIETGLCQQVGKYLFSILFGGGFGVMLYLLSNNYTAMHPDIWKETILQNKLMTGVWSIGFIILSVFIAYSYATPRTELLHKTLEESDEAPKNSILQEEDPNSEDRKLSTSFDN